MTVSSAILFAIASMLGFGLADFMAKALLSKASVFRTVIISQTVGSVMYLALTIAYDSTFPDRTLLSLAAISGCLSTVVLLAFYKALSMGKASLVSPISSCLTAVAIVLSFAFLGEKPNGIQLVLIASVILGILLVAFEKSATKSSSSSLSILLVLVVIFVAGGNTIVQKLIATNGHYLLGFFLSRVFLVGFLVASLPAFRREEPAARSPNRMFAKMALLGVIDVSAFFAWFLGLREGLVSIVAPIANSSAAVTVILARMFLDERVLLHQRIGVVMIILGVALLSAIA